MYTALQFKKTIFEPLDGQALPLHQLCCDLIYLILLFAKCSKKKKKKKPNPLYHCSREMPVNSLQSAQTTKKEQKVQWKAPKMLIELRYCTESEQMRAISTTQSFEQDEMATFCNFVLVIFL